MVLVLNLRATSLCRSGVLQYMLTDGLQLVLPQFPLDLCYWCCAAACILWLCCNFVRLVVLQPLFLRAQLVLSWNR